MEVLLMHEIRETDEYDIHIEENEPDFSKRLMTVEERN